MVCLLSSRETCSQIVSISPIRMTQAECRSGSGAVLVGGCFNKIGASTIQWQSSCARDGKFVVANGACPERYGRLVASAGAEGRTMVSDNVGKSCEEGTTTTGCEEGTGHRSAEGSSVALKGEEGSGMSLAGPRALSSILVLHLMQQDWGVSDPEIIGVTLWCSLQPMDGRWGESSGAADRLISLEQMLIRRGASA